MGEASVKTAGLLAKIAFLYNNNLFSDVEFIFTSSAGYKQKIFGHKLILSLRSKVFAHMFFEKKEGTTFSIELPASEKASFELLFRFLYTDDVQFHTFEEARDLYNLANVYDIEELKEKCYKFMLQDKLTIDNIFSRYECALNKSVTLLLKDCRDFVCSHTELVLESKDFTKASAIVIEDIIKQDNLLISSELEIIKAVLKWGKEELERKELPFDEKYLRMHINQFMKYLRFLTLSSSEFDYFVENYNILSAKESSLLTRKILQPAYDVNFPTDICCTVTKRGKNESSVSNKYSLDSKYFKFSPYSKTESPNPVASVSPNLVASAAFKSVASDSSKSLISDFNKSLRPDFPEFQISDFSKFSTTDSKKSPIEDSPKPTILDSGEFQSSRISYEVKKCATFKEQKTSPYQVKQNLTFSSPYAVSQSFPGGYTFPLFESKPCLDLSFRRDIKCTVTIKVKSGFIALRGFELKIKNENDETDELEVFVHMTGFSEPLSKFYKDKLRNNIFIVMFSKPMILREGLGKGDLEVSIDSLLLNRCSACNNNDDKPYELNKGLDFAVEFSLKSNRKNNGFLFLISKLLF